jgi:hypothetical protein
MATEITEQIVREAPEIEAYRTGLIKSAKDLIAQPMELPAYQVAQMGQDQTRAADIARQGIGTFAPYIQAGGQAVSGGLGTLGQAQQLAGQLPGFARAAGAGLQESLPAAQAMLGAAGTQVAGAAQAYNPNAAQAFMNPYQQAATQSALQEMRRQADISRQGLAAQAVRAGAFGGSREGVQRAEFERGLQDIMSQRIAQDMAANYAQAQQAAMAGQQGQLALLPAQLAAQQANIYGSGAQMLGNIGQTMGQMGLQQAAIGEAGQRMGQADVNMLYNLGEQERVLRQQGLEAARATQLQKTMTPYQQLGFLSDIYKGAPTTSMAITGQSAPTTSPLLSAASLGIGALTAATGAQKAGLFSG